MTLPAQFRDQVIRGDVMDTLRALPDASVDMIFGDPDYGVGINYAGRKFVRKWDEYIGWYVGLARECVRVLRDDGNLFLMNYPKQNAHLRALYLDGAVCEVFDYAWVYPHQCRAFPAPLHHRAPLHSACGQVQEQPLLRRAGRPALQESAGPADSTAHRRGSRGANALLVV